MENKKTAALLDTEHSMAKPLFDKFEYPWEILPHIKEFILEIGPFLDKAVFDNPYEGVYIAKSAKVFGSAHIDGPAVICEGADVRHCAYIRGSVILGRETVAGNSCEFKNCILFDKAAVPHLSYVGDSIVGYHAHFGAGVITSNIKSDGTLVTVRDKNDGDTETFLRKFGAIVGDFADVGCQCVLNPGTVIGRGTRIYPLSNIRGVIREKCIYKSAENIVDMI